MENISGVTFDLDNTLIRYERSPGEVLQTCFETLDLEPLFSVDEYYSTYDAFVETCDSMDELRRRCFAALADANGYDRELGRTVAAVFREERDHTNVSLLPNATMVLEEISNHYEIAMITNGTRDTQWQKITAVGLDQWFETIIVAGDDTPPKPDATPFDRAIESLETTPATTIHIGDSLDTDIAGAHATGMHSVWIGDELASRTIEPTYIVSSLAELVPFPWDDGSVTQR